MPTIWNKNLKKNLTCKMAIQYFFSKVPIDFRKRLWLSFSFKFNLAFEWPLHQLLHELLQTCQYKIPNLHDIHKSGIILRREHVGIGEFLLVIFDKIISKTELGQVENRFGLVATAIRLIHLTHSVWAQSRTLELSHAKEKRGFPRDFWPGALASHSTNVEQVSLRRCFGALEGR